MEYQIVAIRDKALEAFMRPFFAAAVAAAVRDFQDAMKDTQVPMHKHPEHYSLWHFGSFNDANGQFTTFETPKLIVEGNNVSQ